MISHIEVKGKISTHLVTIQQNQSYINIDQYPM